MGSMDAHLQLPEVVQLDDNTTAYFDYQIENINKALTIHEENENDFRKDIKQIQKDQALLSAAQTNLEDLVSGVVEERANKEAIVLERCRSVHKEITELKKNIGIDRARLQNNVNSQPQNLKHRSGALFSPVRTPSLRRRLKTQNSSSFEQGHDFTSPSQRPVHKMKSMNQSCSSPVFSPLKINRRDGASKDGLQEEPDSPTPQRSSHVATLNAQVTTSGTSSQFETPAKNSPKYVQKGEFLTPLTCNHSGSGVETNPPCTPTHGVFGSMDPRFKLPTPSPRPSLAAELGGRFKTNPQSDACIMTLPRIDDDRGSEENQTEVTASEWYDIPLPGHCTEAQETLPELADGSSRNVPEDRDDQGPRVEQSSSRSVFADIQNPSLPGGLAEGLPIEKGVGRNAELLSSKSSLSESMLDTVSRLQEPALPTGLAESSGNGASVDPKNEPLTCDPSLSELQLQELPCGLADHEGLINGDGQDPKAAPLVIACDPSLSEPMLQETPLLSSLAHHEDVQNGDGRDLKSESCTQTQSRLASELATDADSQETASSELADGLTPDRQEADHDHELIPGNQTLAVDEEDTTVVFEGYSLDDASGVKPLAAKAVPATTDINPVSLVAIESKAESTSEVPQKSSNVRWCWLNTKHYIFNLFVAAILIIIGIAIGLSICENRGRNLYYNSNPDCDHPMYGWKPTLNLFQ